MTNETLQHKTYSELTEADFAPTKPIEDPYFDTDRCVKRLLDSYCKHSKLVIASDFDSTLFDFHGEGHAFPKVIQLLKECQELGFYIIVYTASKQERYSAIHEYMEKLGIKVDAINANVVTLHFDDDRAKLFFNILLDDRAGLRCAYNILNQAVQRIQIPETWLPIPGYENKYEASTHGRIRSLSRKSSSGKQVHEKILAQRPDGDGYLYVALYIGGKRKDISIHRIIAIIFISNPYFKDQVNHIDGVKTNNHIKNLEWVTVFENQQHAFRTHLNVRPYGKESAAFKGEIEAFDQNGNSLGIFAGSREIQMRGWHLGAVYDCVNGKRKHYRKMTFKRLSTC